jgi:hypothetical protein
METNQDLLVQNATKLFTDIEGIVTLTDENLIKENANKDSKLIPTQRDLVAGAVSRYYALNKLLPENIAKAQKKVLTNLTKNPRYYTEKMCGKGEVSEEWVEVTKKEIDKIGKGKSKIIREGIHDRDITSAPHTNVKGEMGDYDPKARATNLAKLKDFGPKEGDVSARDIAQALIPLAANKGEIV